SVLHDQGERHRPRAEQRPRGRARRRRRPRARALDRRRGVRRPLAAERARMTSVLIVEDDQLLAKALCRDLSEHPFSVKVANGFDEAMAVLRSTAVDVMLTDLRLGTADGIDLLENVRKLSPRTRSVLMSGFATARDYQREIGRPHL